MESEDNTEDVDDDIDEQTEFTYDELSEKAKDRVRARYRETYGADDEWWDYTYEDAERIGRLLGIEIGTRAVNGRTYRELDINFQLYVQGAGACYSGELDVAKLQGACSRVAAEVGPNDTHLHRLAKDAETLYEQIRLRVFTRKLMGLSEYDEDEDGEVFDEIGLSDSLSITDDDRAYRTSIEDNNAKYPCELKELADALVDGFADWIYHNLETESDWRDSDEYIDEQLADSAAFEDTRYDEDGNEI